MPVLELRFAIESVMYLILLIYTHLCTVQGDVRIPLDAFLMSAITTTVTVCTYASIGF